MRYYNLCIKLGTWKVCRLNQSRSTVVPQSKFPAGLGAKNGWAVPNWKVRRLNRVLGLSKSGPPSSYLRVRMSGPFNDVKIWTRPQHFTRVFWQAIFLSLVLTSPSSSSSSSLKTTGWVILGRGPVILLLSTERGEVQEGVNLSPPVLFQQISPSSLNLI